MKTGFNKASAVDEKLFVLKALRKARKLGFSKSVVALTNLLEAEFPTFLDQPQEGKRQAASTGATRVQQLIKLPFAAGEAELIQNLSERGIITRPDLIRALATQGRHKPSIETDLTRLLRQTSLAPDISRPSQNTAKAIYQLAGLSIPEHQPADIQHSRTETNGRVRTPSVAIQRAANSSRRGIASKSLTAFPIAKGEALLLSALAERGINSRVDLVLALTKAGRSRPSVETELVRLLRQNSLSADLAKGSANVARSIYEIAGLDLPRFIAQPTATKSNVPKTTSNLLHGVAQINPLAEQASRKSRLLSSFPFAYKARPLIEALAAKGIVTRADLLGVMDKRKLSTSGVPKFLDGQVIDRRGGAENLSFTAQAIATIARLPCSMAFSSSDGAQLPAAPIHSEIRASSAQPAISSTEIPTKILSGYRICESAPTLVTALAERGLSTENDLRSALVTAGVPRLKAATALKEFLDGAISGIVRHHAGSTSTGRFFSDLAQMPFARVLAESNDPHRREKTLFPAELPPTSPAKTEPVSPNDSIAVYGRATSELQPAIVAKREIANLTNASNALADQPEIATQKSQMSNGGASKKHRSSDPFEIGLIAALPKLRVHALNLTKKTAAAEDLVQQTMMNALASQGEGSGFQPHPDMTYQGSLNAWLNRILRNAFISGLRKGKAHLYSSLTSDDDNTEGGLNYLPVSERQENILETQQVFDEIDRLPPDQKDALLRVVIHGENYEQLAEHHGVALGTAKSRVFRARNHLREMMGRPKLEDLPALTD